MKTRFRNPVMFLMAALLCAFVVASCGGDDGDATPATDFTTLNASIAAAQAKLAATVEGKADGQYSKASRDALQAAITAAQAVVTAGTVTQAQADAANTQLNLAITAYDAAKIAPVAAEALVAYWNFDEGTGTTIADQSANAFTGTFKAAPETWGGGMPAWGTDRFGVASKAIYFGEDGGSIEVPYNTKLNPATAISIAVWVNAEVMDANNRFLGLQSWIGYKFQLQDNVNRPFFTMGYGGNTYEDAYNEDSAQDLPLASWHHLVVTYNSDGTMVFYVDGVLLKTWTHPAKAPHILDKQIPLVIGQDFPTSMYVTEGGPDFVNFNDPESDEFHMIPLDWGGRFHGSIDELRIYNTVLTEQQVGTIYDREAPPANP